MDNVSITKIRCENADLYDKNAKKNNFLEIPVEQCPIIKEKKDIYELHV